MSEQKHTKGPWENREGSIIADTREQVCCGRPCVGAEYMGQQEMVCCGNPDMDGEAEEVIATVAYERDIPLVIAAPEMLAALRDIVEFCDDPAGDSKTESLAMGLARLLPAARAALSKATGQS